MKIKIKNISFLLIIFCCGFSFSCKKKIIGETGSDDTLVTAHPKGKFALYDAMAYPGKPDLTSDGLLPIYLMYEAALTQPDPGNSKRMVLDMDKINIQATLASEFPDVMVSTDIESWYGESNLDEHVMFDRFKAMFDVFKDKNPRVTIGNYGIAPSALCVYRYYNKDKWADEIIVQNWKNSNANRWKSIEAADVIMPVVYIAEPNIEAWVRDLEITIQEIRKYNTEKKIVVYIWPQYYDKPDSPYKRQIITPSKWRQILEAVYERCDGAIIWSGKTDGGDNTLHWKDARLQDIWNETKDFMNVHRTNMVEPSPERELLSMDNPNKKFKIFASLNYAGTPDLAPYKIHRIKTINEKDLSTGAKVNGAYIPDFNKIRTFASSQSDRNVPICIMGGTWISDRNTDQSAMVERYRSVSSAFKDVHSDFQLGFALVGPTSLSGLRVSNSSFYVNTAGWMQSAVIPARGLRTYADYLLPASYIIDDDIALWTKEFYLTIKEAKLSNPGKPIYAYLYTDYFNQVANFQESYKPIREETWEAMLEAVYKVCDGVVMSNIGTANWSDNLGFWKATTKFMNKYASNIESPPVQTGWSIAGNVIQNGSFEEPVIPSAITESVYGVTYPALLNFQGFFDPISRTVSPSSPATTIGKYVWFERGTSQSECRTYVYDGKARSGTNSLAVHNVGGNTTNATSTTWMYHNLAQKLTLDDTKKYKLSISVQRDFKYRSIDNNVNKIYVGIVSGTGATSPTNYTYYQEVHLQSNEKWNEYVILLDLPAILSNTGNAGKSFENSAVFIGLQTGWDTITGKTTQSIVYLDDISLVESK
ncbi:hypothetical protein [Sphingobacterium tabacisoli]|uniref:Uncharacterized protein n=1 Tax=Sphingobacterium tabacisoli TaxID=2044855 RepID=A0ABW5L6R4_9SPHI|nr:hypothetical protein [Sphingobacterium tabacisoli]